MYYNNRQARAGVPTAGPAAPAADASGLLAALLRADPRALDVRASSSCVVLFVFCFPFSSRGPLCRSLASVVGPLARPLRN
jgi:hypothetical protein